MSTPPAPEKKPVGQDDLMLYLKTHTREAVSYVLIVLGIIMMFFDQMYGGLLVGIIAGIYFGEEIVAYLKSINTDLKAPDLARRLILAGLAIAFLIAAPSIFLGAAIAIVIQQLFLVPKTK